MKVQIGVLQADLDGNKRPLSEAAAELEREINLRMRMYPEWVKQRKLSSLDAVDRLERMAKAHTALIAAYPELQGLDPNAEAAEPAKEGF